MNINQLCMKCMIGKINEEGKCTNCGATDSSEKNGSLHLPVRSILKGKYLIGKVIGEGGFGITYIGFDLDLEIRVAIKEFCPKQYVGREAEDGLTIYPYNEKDAEFFDNEKQKFINEARRLAKFRNEGGVVSVLDYFIENGTAYIVMDYIDGITLKSYLKTLHSTTGKNMSMAGVLNLFKPVMETLEKIHNANIIHRDISPENIMISKDFTKVYLIDFGTARDIEDGHTLSEYSKSFYTPIEQMSEKMKQGPWTDVYALCATIYVCITGRTLPESVSRLLEDDLVGPRKYGVEISEDLEAVLIKGLAVKPEDRIQSMEELMQALYGDKKLIECESKKENEYLKVNEADETANVTGKYVSNTSDNNVRNVSAQYTEHQFEKRKSMTEMAKMEKRFKFTRTICVIIMIIIGFYAMNSIGAAVPGTIYGSVFLLVWTFVTNIVSKKISVAGLLTLSPKGSGTLNVFLKILLLPGGAFTLYALYGESLYSVDWINELVEDTREIADIAYLSMAAIVFHIIWICIIFLFTKKFASKMKNLIFPNVPNIGDVLLQIEAMRHFLIYGNGGFKTRTQLNRDAYKKIYFEHEGQAKHKCHKFLIPEVTSYAINRFELLDYYNQVILPSTQIPKELKEKWKEAAIASWVLIED